MANPDFPQNREEMLLNALAGFPYDAPVPVPQSRVEKLLAFLAENGIPGNVKIGEDVATVADLPAEGKVGDMHYVTAESLFYVYKITDGAGEWIPVGADFDPSEFARADGTYPEMTVGRATNADYSDVAEYAAYSEQLDSNQKLTVSTPFVFRPAGGGADVEGYLGSRAKIAAVYGNTLVWNQLVGDDTAEVVLKSGHVYLTRIGGTDALVSGSGASVSVTGGTDNVFDLTRMFGAGSAPASVDAFRAFFPLPYYAYDAGRLLNFTGTGIKTVGFNQFNKSDIVPGKIIESGGAETSVAGRGHSNYIRVIPGVKYYNNGFGGTNTYNGAMYTADKVFVRMIVGVSFVAPDNVCYVILNFYNSNIDTANFNFAWSGYRNGETEPYRTETKAIPVSTYFPDGMKSAGTVRDELRADVAVRRCGTRAYQEGDESDPTVVTDGTNTVYALAEPVETPIDQPLDMVFDSSDYGTEMSLPENGSEPTTTPMNAAIDYVRNLRDKLQNLPDGTGVDGDYYVQIRGVKQTYKPLPAVPTEDGVYSLKCTVADGTPVFAWVADEALQNGGETVE